MLTGDNPLTACHVAKELKIAQRKLLILSHVASSEKDDDVIPSEEWEWQSIGGASKATLEADPAELGKDHDLCVTGDVSITSSQCNEY
jgi:cation-transporting ATPase 13A1